MEIKFHTMRVKNFLSVGNTWLTYNLDQFRTNLIIGKNGHGKSQMIDALCFVLYNRPFRRINRSQLVNSVNGRGLVVDIEFTAGQSKIRVVRGMKTNLFEIYVNGVLQKHDAGRGDYQHFLEHDILRTNFKTFCQVVIMGSATYTPFMELTAAHRREVVEDLLDLEIFAVMLSIIKSNLEESKAAAQTITKRTDVLIAQRDTITKQMEQQQQVDDEMVAKINAQIEEIRMQLGDQELDILEMQAEHDRLINLLNRSADPQPKQAAVRKLIGEASHFVTGEARHIKMLCDNASCPTCEQEISEEFRAERVKEKTESIEQYEKAIEGLQVRLAKLDETEGKRREVTQKISQSYQGIKMAQNVLAHTGKRLADLETARDTNVSLTTDNSAENKRLLKQISKELKAASTQLKAIKETHNIHQFALTLVRDGGIKSQIIKRYIPLINELINSYLTAMEFFVSFELNEMFEEKIKSRHRDEFSYASFSEGEKMRINLAIMFAWRAVARHRNSANISLLIFDEVFDGALDVGGMDELIKLLTDVGNTTNVWVISHRTDQLLDKFDNVIEIVKEKNFSTMRQVV